VMICSHLAPRYGLCLWDRQWYPALDATD
jgi:hypothetical protein